MKNITSTVKHILRNRFLSYALLLSAFFIVAHLLGFREYTNILSGTSQIEMWKMYCGMVYIILYVCFVGIVPIFLIAAALMYGVNVLHKKA